MKTKRLLGIICLTLLGASLSFLGGILVAEWKIRSANPIEIVPGSSSLQSKIPAEDISNSGQNKEETLEQKALENFSGAVDANQSEKNVLIENQGNSFSFAVIGDTQMFKLGNSGGGFQKAVANIKKDNVNLVFALGDLVSSCDGKAGCEKKYNDWKDIMGDLLGKTYVAQGNHDRTGKDMADAVWQKTFNFPTNGPIEFSELTYSFDFSNSHFVVLDSEKPEEDAINSVQRDWLEKDLTNNKKENVFVFYHEPAYPVSSKIGESLDAKKSDRDALWNILVKYKVKAVFNGHEHIYSRRKVDGVYQFVFGNTDSFDHDLPKPGVAEYSYQGNSFGIVKVEGKKITVNLYSADGELINFFQLP